MNGFDFAYATNVGHDPEGLGIAGLGLRASLYSDYDGELEPGGSSAAQRLDVLLPNIAGGDATLGTSLFAGWIFTVDLEGTGLEFSWPVTDFDDDGGHDVGYVYSFEQNQTIAKGVCGPFLVRPFSLGGRGDAFGCPDRLEWFNDSAGERTGFAGGFWFGGGDCPAGRPYASSLLNLYGYGGFDPCAVIDYNCDGIIDFTDYLEFLNRFDGGDAHADLNRDGMVDFADYLEFLNLFDACSAG